MRKEYEEDVMKVQELLEYEEPWNYYLELHVLSLGSWMVQEMQEVGFQEAYLEECRNPVVSLSYVCPHHVSFVLPPHPLQSNQDIFLHYIEMLDHS